MIENPVLQVVNGRETENSFRERQESVPHRLRFSFPTACQRVIAENPVGLDAVDVGLVVQLVRVPETIAAGENQTATRCRNYKLVGRAVDALVAAYDVLVGDLDFCREVVGPEGE